MSFLPYILPALAVKVLRMLDERDWVQSPIASFDFETKRAKKPDLDRPQVGIGYKKDSAKPGTYTHRRLAHEYVWWLWYWYRPAPHTLRWLSPVRNGLHRRHGEPVPCWPRPRREATMYIDRLVNGWWLVRWQVWNLDIGGSMPVYHVFETRAKATQFAYLIDVQKWNKKKCSD